MQVHQSMLTMCAHRRYTHPFTIHMHGFSPARSTFPTLHIPFGLGAAAHPLPMCRSTWFARRSLNLHQGSHTKGPGASLVQAPAKPTHCTHGTHVTKHAGINTPAVESPFTNQISLFVLCPCVLSTYLFVFAETTSCTSRSGNIAGFCCTDVLSCGVTSALHTFFHACAPISSLVE